MENAMTPDLIEAAKVAEQIQSYLSMRLQSCVDRTKGIESIVNAAFVARDTARDEALRVAMEALETCVQREPDDSDTQQYDTDKVQAAWEAIETILKEGK